ncbi:MAG: M48 family metallopeptidase [Anaerolineae bacterium]|nr:M48 family metallopeptidase [Anaerolineae bacterium]
MTQRSKNPDGQIMRRVPDGPHTLAVEVTRDRRLRKSVRWTVEHDTIQVRVPPHVGSDRLDSMLDDIVKRVLKQRQRARHRNDTELERRAEVINRQYFGGELHWHTIRWVNNMQRRLGSCTTGGATDGDIRISDRIKHWPVYVLEYVIAHELAHRKYPDHSPAFWDYLARYPQTERARGFIEGIAYAQGDDPDGLL